jgi:hypothetical protein
MDRDRGASGHEASPRAVGSNDLRYLARLARCDPSRLGLDSSRLKDWLLVRDDWVVACPLCILADLKANMPAYERVVWRVSTVSFCLRHRAPLVKTDELPEHLDDCSLTRLTFSDLEKIVADQLMKFEREIAHAHRGHVPSQFAETLNAVQYLQVLCDLCTFAVDLWDTDHYRVTNSLAQHEWPLRRHCPQLFSYRPPRRTSYGWKKAGHLTLTAIADPAMRRAALWLVREAIQSRACVGPQHSLRLGNSAQNEFLGNRPHAGWAWLESQARAWPSAYRSRYWQRFKTDGDTVNGSNDTVKGTE